MWGATNVLVYHGSYKEIHEPNVTFGREALDFGLGFYVTTLQDQAEKWALRNLKKKDILIAKPIVNVYDFDNQGLLIKSFNGYSEDWFDFVCACRSKTAAQQHHDATFGNMADDDVATAVDDYMSQLRAGRITPLAKLATLELLSFSKPTDQFCIHKQSVADSRLSFLHSYEVGVDT